MVSVKLKMYNRAYFFAIFSVLYHLSIANIILQDTTGRVQFEGEKTTEGLNIVLKRDNEVRLQGVLGPSLDFSNVDCVEEAGCNIDNVEILIEPIEEGFSVTWKTDSLTEVFQDCYDLQVGTLNWYGGPQRYVQKWPIEKLSLSGNDPYIINKNDNFAVAERYWLNSKGAYIFVDENAPLFIDQNTQTSDGKICFIAKAKEPYINRSRVLFNYKLVVLDDSKQAHLHAVNNYLGKPTGYPDEKMVAQPIWTTWAKYKKDISDDVVIQFAKDIYERGFTEGQIEIDDNWETCYGAQTFRAEAFSNISNTVKTLKEIGYRVTLWVHPFVNADCDPVYTEGTKNGYFVKNPEGNEQATWWDGDNARQIDFTKSEAGEWFSSRLKTLQENPGIDSFKFDAGETNYGPQPSIYEGVDVETIPNILTKKYIETVAKFGTLIEARSAWRTQSLPTFTRMIDKASSWDENNGLYTLITTLLQMNMNGYGFVLPDMIGGNGYAELYPDAELILRWAQANALMPAMQFSYLPWDYTLEGVDSVRIVKKFVDLHSNYSDVIITAMKKAVLDGSPVNPPIWWADPKDPIALAIDDEYLLGESILVAPVIVKGATSRNVYLPKGTWKDGNSGEIYEGPISVQNYDAPLDVLPYFIKQ